MVQAIWEHEVIEIDGRPYLAAGDWAVKDDQVIFAPATFAPYAYHFFATADPEHNWWYLLDINYQLLADVSQDPLGEERSAGLPPAYIGINRNTGEFVVNPDGVPADGTSFDEQAAQVYWRVGLDAQWHDDGRADSFLTASRFLHDEWQAKGSLSVHYAHSGKLRSHDDSLLMYSLVLPKFLIEDPEVAHELYGTKLAPAYRQQGSEGLWGDAQDFNQERWAWLASGLYANILTYQWGAATEPEQGLPPILAFDSTWYKISPQKVIKE
jgi:endoglucanase